MKTIITVTVLLMVTLMFIGCSVSPKQPRLLYMNEGMCNKFTLPPTEDSDSLSVYLQVSYSDIYVHNYNSQPVGVKIIEFFRGEPREIGLDVWLEQNQEATFLGSPNFSTEYLVEVHNYKDPDNISTLLEKYSTNPNPLTTKKNEWSIWELENSFEVKKFKFIVEKKI